MAGLKLKHLYKVYSNGTKAVSDFSIDIEDKEFIIFVGPSGCGKSTTLRMIAGLEEITSGDLYIGDTLVNDIEPKDRDIAMVFQNYALYPHMSVFQNMAFGLKLRKLSKEEIEERVKNALKILEIEHYINKKPKEMSGGERQRVALGRAIVRNPKVFLLDEPLSNLDAKLRATMRTEISKLHQKLQTTFIYVTHDQVEAMTMGTRIVVMNKGFVQQIDTPKNLYNHPVNKFVAGFIGSPQMNFFEVMINKCENMLEIEIFNEKLKFDFEYFTKLDPNYANSKVVLGIRPEDIEISTECLSNSAFGYVEVIEELGAEANYILKLENGENIVIRTKKDLDFTLGQKVYFNLKPDKIHLFDKENEHTIMPRIPSSFKAFGTLGDTLEIFGKKIEIPKWMMQKEENAIVEFDDKAITLGKTFSLKIDKVEVVDKDYVVRLKYNDQYLFVKTDQKHAMEEYYSFDLDLKQLKITTSKVIEPLKDCNEIIGELVKSKKQVMLNNHKKQVLGCNYVIDGVEIDIDYETSKKITDVLPNDFALHKMKYLFSAYDAKITDVGIKGTVKSMISYPNELFAKIEVGNTEIIVRSDFKYACGEEVNVEIDYKKIEVVDAFFDVKIV